MMAAARIDASTDLALEDDVASLWADGFDTVEIANVLTEEGAPITEAAVCEILARQQDGRHRAKDHQATGVIR